MPWEKEGELYPWPDPETKTMVVGHRGDFRIEVTPMIFNDRILVTHRSEYPHLTVAGFCYDKVGGLAMIAANAWLLAWDELDVPPGFKKEAFNALPRYGKGI